MKADKDKLIVMAAEVFREFMLLSKVKWDGAFLRFVKYGPSHASIQMSYVCQKTLIMGLGQSIESKKKREYQNTLQNLMNEVFKELEKEPVVSVLKIEPNGSYNVKFDYTDTNALEINLIRLGLENSYFTSQDVDIPEDVKELQKKMADV